MRARREENVSNYYQKAARKRACIIPDNERTLPQGQGKRRERWSPWEEEEKREQRVCLSNRFSLSSSSSPSTALMVPGSRFETPFPPSPPIIELFLYYYREQQLSPLLLLLLPTLNYFFQIFHYFFQTSLLSLRIRIKDYIGAMHAREDACNPRIGKFCTDP